MKKKQLQELQTKTKDELGKLVSDLEKEMRKLKTEMNLKKVKNVNELKSKMKDKARMLTLMKGAK